MRVLPPKFTLRLPPGELHRYASEYESIPEDEACFEVARRARRRGWLTNDDLMAFCRWKAPRSAPRCKRNEPDFLKEVSGLSFRTSNERLRVESLQLLDGVGWPMASVILHFCAEEGYPILDYRALWSLGIETPPSYTFLFWRDYTDHCRQLSREARLSMRELDRALWMYSRKHR